MPAKYVLKRRSDGQFMFNLKAGNGEVILTSEGYEAKASAESGIESVRANSRNDDRYERRNTAGGSPYFVLKAANGQIIGRSETYSSASARDGGIESTKANGSASILLDETE